MTTQNNSSEEAPRANEPRGAVPFTPGEVAGIVPPLIGRDRELQRLLQDLYGVIKTGEARLVTIVGPAGIGKSRLAHELRQVVARLPDSVAILSLQADRQSASQPYSLVRLLIGALFRLREGDEPATVRARIEQGVSALLGRDGHERAHFIGQLAGYDFAESPHLGSFLAEPRQIAEQALGYIAECLGAATATTPVVLICDDLDDADDRSLDAIARIVAGEPAVAALVVCLAQQQFYERRPGWGGARIELRPLNEHDSRRLVGEILRKAGKLPPDLRAMIVSRAEGNPLYVEELVKMLIADGVILPGSEAWQIRPGRLSRLRIPSTLADLLRARLQALRPVEREFLILASVVGRVFWAEAALVLNGAARERGSTEDAVAASSILGSLERTDLVAPLPDSRFPGQREYVFRHALLHEVAYGQVRPDMRQAYHQRVAEWLIEHSGDRVAAYAGLIADHYERGGRGRKAAAWHVQAGDYARSTYGVQQALAQYQAALTLLPAEEETLPDRIACYEGLGETQAAVARLGDAIASFTRMAELADQLRDGSAAARAWNGLAYVLDYNLDYKEAETSARRALELAEAAGDGLQLALALFNVAWAELRNEQPRAALDLARRALVVLTQLNEPASTSRCLAVVGIAHEQLGHYEAARQSLEEALAYNRAMGDLKQMASLLNNLGYVANGQGDYEAALAYLEEGLQVADQGRSRLGEIYILTNLARTCNGLGDHARAEAEARRGIDLCEASRITVSADFTCALSEACLGQGRVTEAIEAAQQALDTARASEGPREVAAACQSLGRAISALEDSQGARPCFEESARIYAEAGAIGEQARSLRAWARFELRSGDPGRARELWQQARERFADLGLTHELARTPAEPDLTGW